MVAVKITNWIGWYISIALVMASTGVLWLKLYDELRGAVDPNPYRVIVLENHGFMCTGAAGLIIMTCVQRHQLLRFHNDYLKFWCHIKGIRITAMSVNSFIPEQLL